MRQECGLSERAVTDEQVEEIFRVIDADVRMTSGLALS
eukprot:COSAG01_NODE_959_length_12451_cov_18.389815_5_plen_38_part_00